MKKRNKVGISIETPEVDAQSEIPDITPSKVDNSRANISKLKKAEIQVHSDIKPQQAEVSSDKDLLKRVEMKIEPSDGREQFQDAAKYNGWRKVEYFLDQQNVICENFSKTGYCAFGDACKYLHTRDKFSSSYEADRELEAKAYLELTDKVKKAGELAQPEVCPICSKMYVRPVITMCHHKFCQKCAQERYNTDETCAVCGKNTMGVFNLCQDSRFSSEEPKN